MPSPPRRVASSDTNSVDGESDNDVDSDQIMQRLDDRSSTLEAQKEELDKEADRLQKNRERAKKNLEEKKQLDLSIRENERKMKELAEDQAQKKAQSEMLQNETRKLLADFRNSLDAKQEATSDVARRIERRS